LFSVPAIILFIFSLWRTITISGIAIAAVSNGQRFVKSQAGFSIIAKLSVTKKATEAAIEAEIRGHQTGEKGIPINLCNQWLN
jgi:hypothetical protein